MSSREAVARLRRFGQNATIDVPPTRILIRIAKRFTEPLVLILLVAAAISGVTRDLASFGIILTVLSLSISLDVIQEHRADNAAQALKRSVAIHADVQRDGVARSVPVEQVVPGDVVNVRAGDLIPADGIVLTSHGLHVNEALMTGEPFPVEKHSETSDAKQVVEATNALFAGTSVVSGEAIMLVVATGRQTKFGGISAALASQEPPSALERGIHRLGLMILRLTIFLVLFVLLMNSLYGRALFESFLFAVALAVGLTPELLPMIMTVTLSRGAIRMAKKRVIVKRLAAIHDLGAIDTLCTDKTGTLTEQKIELTKCSDARGNESDRVLVLAAINSHFEKGVRSPLDAAIIGRCGERELEGWRRLDEIPFDFERRCVSVLVAREELRLLIAKGAVEPIFAKCTTAHADDRTELLDDAMRDKLRVMHEELATQGFRTLAVATRKIPPIQETISVEDECNLELEGFCIFIDPPKLSAAGAIARLSAQGIRVKVISGDHEAVVQHLISTLKMPTRGLLRGDELAGLTDAALAARVEETDLFARVTPDQKTRIIRALQARGNTVGFLGDGINDAPAIRAAEVGLSVEGATDVARAAADMILLDQDLGVIADGVEEGRRTLANIIKYVRMGTSSNFGNMLSMAAASVVLPFLPLLPVQILLNNLIYDFSEIGIPLDNVEGDELVRPRIWNMKEILAFTLIMGTVSSLFDILTFVILNMSGATPDEFRTAWFVESMATQILVIFVIRTKLRAWKSRPNSVLVTTSLLALGTALFLAFGPIADQFKFVPVPLYLLTAIVLIVVGYLVTAEVTKTLALPQERRGEHL